jgi:copper chaperone CopZ
METTRTDLLTGANVADAGETDLMGGCCGGGSCMCGSPASSETETPATGAELTGTEFLVTGMTCGHCVSSVTEEVSAIEGVDSVEVVLKKGGASRVVVTSAAPVDKDAVSAAVEEAGYQLA